MKMVNYFTFKDVYQFKKEILRSITKKLIFTVDEARQDINLRDEYIRQTNEYRFRVTPRPNSTRIHYTFIDNKIIFLRYYDIGEHDDGL